jgi:hypothetical protein
MYNSGTEKMYHVGNKVPKGATERLSEGRMEEGNGRRIMG